MPNRPGPMLTKVLATVGPATDSVEMIVRLIREGVRVFRINFSHGNFKQFDGLRSAIREASVEAGSPVGILGDLSGPKIRVGKQPKRGILLSIGDHVTIQRNDLTPQQRGENGAPGGAIVNETDWQKLVCFSTT